MKQLLPIGTVVNSNLDGALVKLMIIGYYPKSEDNLYDYLTVVYPMGMSLDFSTIMLADENIDSIYDYGFDNEKYTTIVNDFSETVNKVALDSIVDFFDKISEEIKLEDETKNSKSVKSKNIGEFG